MAEGRQKVEWSRTAEVVAMIYNMHRTAKMPYKAGTTFNPMVPQKSKEEERLPVTNEEAFAIMKKVFVK